MGSQERAFSLRKKERGVTGVEFAILVASIALAVYAGGMVMGKNISGKIANAEQQIQNQSQRPATPAATDGGSAGAGGNSGAGGGTSGGDYAGGPGDAKQGSQPGK